MFYRAVDAKQKLELALKTEEQDRHALAAKLKKVLMIYTNIGRNIWQSYTYGMVVVVVSGMQL